MKKLVVAVVACALMFACTPGDKGNTPAEPIVPAGAEDLGIVMTREDGTTYNLYWATSNLDEDGLCPNPEDYGDYYAWGETVPHYVKGHSQDNPCSNWRTIEGNAMTGYYWTSYKWCSGSSSTLTKYNTKESNGAVDNISELQRGEKLGETVDDVVRAKLGGKWRMPTDADWTALRACEWVWTENYKGTGVNGMLVTAPNGNSIFLPAAGRRVDTELNGADSYGLFWSSSLNADIPYYAWGVYFDSEHVDRSSGSRCYGRPIRPVSE